MYPERWLKLIKVLAQGEFWRSVPGSLPVVRSPRRKQATTPLFMSSLRSISCTKKPGNPWKRYRNLSMDKRWPALVMNASTYRKLLPSCPGWSLLLARISASVMTSMSDTCTGAPPSGSVAPRCAMRAISRLAASTKMSSPWMNPTRPQQPDRHRLPHQVASPINIYADKSSNKEYNFLGTLAWGITINQRKYSFAERSWT